MSEPPPREPPPREPVQRWRLVLRRAASEPGAAQKQWLQAVADRLVATGLPIAGLDAAPPRPRVVLGAPLPAGIPGEGELLDVLLTEREPAWRVRDAVREALPDGDTLVDAHDVWLGAPALPGHITGSVYRIRIPPPEALGAAPGADRTFLEVLRRAAAAMLAATSLPRMRRKGDTEVPYELRPFLEGLDADPDPDGDGIAVRALLRHDPEKGIGRPEEVLAELGERCGAALEARSVVRERLLLADELPPRVTDRPLPPPARPGRDSGRSGRGPAPGPSRPR